jgi:hypothetical protein
MLWEVVTESSDAELTGIAVAMLQGDAHRTVRRNLRCYINHSEAAWLAAYLFYDLEPVPEHEVASQFSGFLFASYDVASLPFVLLNFLSVAESAKGCTFLVDTERCYNVQAITITMDYGGIAIIVILKDERGLAWIREPYRDSLYLAERGRYSRENAPRWVSRFDLLRPEGVERAGSGGAR